MQHNPEVSSPDQAHHLHPSCLSMFQSLNADAFDQVRLTEVVGKHDAKSLVVRRSYLRCCVSIRVQTQQRTVRKAVLSFLNYFAAVDWFRLTLRLLSLRSLQYFAFLLSKSQILPPLLTHHEVHHHPDQPLRPPGPSIRSPQPTLATQQARPLHQHLGFSILVRQRLRLRLLQHEHRTTSPSPDLLS